jgi:signal peptidase I
MPADDCTEKEVLRLTENHSVANSAGSAPSEKNRGSRPDARITPLMRLLIKVASLALLAFLMLTFVMGVHIHHGNRMYPFVMDGDVVITYKLEEYRVGDVVAYRHPDTGKTELSRIVAIGENVIQITNYGELLINGTAPAEEVFYPTYRCETADITYPYTVGDDQVFILNDFRSDINDSRSFGAVDIKDVKGPVLIMLRRRGF